MRLKLMNAIPGEINSTPASPRELICAAQRFVADRLVSQQDALQQAKRNLASAQRAFDESSAELKELDAWLAANPARIAPEDIP